MLQRAFCLRAGRIAVLALLCASTAALTARGADSFRPDESGRPQSRAARAAAISLPADAPRQGRRLEAGRNADRRAGTEDRGARGGPRASALALCAAERRHSGRRIQIAQRAAHPAAEGHRHGLDRIVGDVGRRHGRKQSHHAAARRERRREAGDPQRSSSTTLASPFGVALVGSDLYVANTDADRALSLQ